LKISKIIDKSLMSYYRSLLPKIIYIAGYFWRDASTPPLYWNVSLTNFLIEKANSSHFLLAYGRVINFFFLLFWLTSASICVSWDDISTNFAKYLGITRSITSLGYWFRIDNCLSRCFSLSLNLRLDSFAQAFNEADLLFSRRQAGPV